METYIKILEKQVLLMDIELHCYKMTKNQGLTPDMSFEEYSAILLSKGYLNRSLKILEKAKNAVISGTDLLN